ncbi:serine hydrolase [Kribbella sp. NPDC026596]|uniref:serine hydrolase n=1 Tax=Kribbella sp. NPDC026596 TaxID=3155122 RepID=UPI003400F7E0
MDVEDLHGYGRHAGRRGRSTGSRRADHDVPARVHCPQRVRGASRAEDHAPDAPGPYRPLHPRGPAGGGLYTSATDLTRFLRFQLSDGSIGGRVVLDPKSMEELRTVPAPSAGAPAGYALGVMRTRWNRWDQRPDLFTHGGGGFGFLSDLWWLPQVRIGIAILTNSQDHQLQGDLALSILGDLVTEPGVYRDRLLALPPRPPVVDPSRFEPPAGMTKLVAKAAMATTGDEPTRWAGYSGPYRAPEWGALAPTGPLGRFVVDAGVPYFEVETDSLIRHQLVEVAPGLFLADSGETLDLRGPDPRWQGLRLVRVAEGPAVWQWSILGTAALVAAAWLVAAAAREVRRHRTRSASGERPAGLRRIAALTPVVTAMLTIANVALLAWMPGLVDSGFLGWLDIPLAQRLALHLPLALAVLSASTLVLMTAGWALRWWSNALKLHYAVLAVASVTVIAQLATWHLIGWGLT